MRKQLLTLLMAIGAMVYSHSQYYGGHGFICFDCATSIEAGILSSNISGMDDATSKLGFYIGFYQYKEINDAFAFRFGTSYNNIGAKVKGAESPLIIHSINFPISLHYRFKEKFQGFAGGELSTNFFGKLPEFERGEDSTDYFDFRDNLTLLDASVLFGVGYILGNNIDINLKYNLGVTNLHKEEYTKGNWKKNWATLSVGYTFRD